MSRSANPSTGANTIATVRRRRRAASPGVRRRRLFEIRAHTRTSSRTSAASDAGDGPRGGGPGRPCGDQPAERHHAPAEPQQPDPGVGEEAERGRRPLRIDRDQRGVQVDHPVPRRPDAERRRADRLGGRRVQVQGRVESDDLGAVLVEHGQARRRRRAGAAPRARRVRRSGSRSRRRSRALPPRGSPRPSGPRAPPTRCPRPRRGARGARPARRTAAGSGASRPPRPLGSEPPRARSCARTPRDHLGERGRGDERDEPEDHDRGRSPPRRTRAAPRRPPPPRRDLEPSEDGRTADAARHGSIGPTPIRNSRARATGAALRLKKGAADRDLLAAHGLGEQRVDRADEHRERDDQQQHVVREERALARQRRVEPRLRRAGPRAATRSEPNPPTSTSTRNARYSGPTIDCANVWTDDRMLPRVRNVPRTVSANVPTISDRFQTFSIPRRSCTITECRNAVPVSHGSSATFSTGSHAQYPPHPSTPYDHSAPSDEAEREEDPGRDRPPPRDPHPLVAHPARDERGDREGERHREPDEPEVQHRRVHGHQRVVLEQRQRTATRRPGALASVANGVVGPRTSSEIERAHAEHRRKGPRERLGAPAAEPERHRGEVSAEHEVPEQERALVRRPEREHLEERRRVAAGVRRDVLHREVVGQQPGEHREVRDHDEREQRVRGGSRALDERGPARPSADDPDDEAVDREREGERERDRPDDGRHLAHLGRRGRLPRRAAGGTPPSASPASCRSGTRRRRRTCPRARRRSRSGTSPGSRPYERRSCASCRR